MKKKILISTVVIIMILSMSLMIFAGCKPKMDELDENFAIPTAHIGANGGKLSSDMVEGGIKSINSNMSAFDMLQVGMENFYNAKYATIEYNGGVFMTLAGFIQVEQVVQSTKIRDGVGDADGNNENGATYFADNKSHSAFAKLYEKFIIRPNEWTRKAVASKKNGDAADGKVSYTKPGKRGGRLGIWDVDKWGSVKSYDTLDALVTANSNNPTILWMYDLQEEFITDSRGPKYDETEKSYKFSFMFDPEKSTEEYQKVMLVQLESNAGMPIEGLKFKQLMLEVVLWENGMIRAINVSEIYHMKMVLAGTGIDSDVKLTATQLFSYDPNEEGYKINDHINAF
ncbi:MAG: hypothetical protein K2L70_06265 [Clostridia bacterium]|nr:hypothetical protein [Clostridia bacterium]